MMYSVIYSRESRTDLEDIYKYIADELMNKGVAIRQSKNISKVIRRLSTMPKRYPVYRDEPWHSKEIRYVPIDSYIVFYSVNENLKIVNIVRIMYGASDLTKGI